MNLAPSPNLTPPIKTRNQLILEHVKNSEDFELIWEAYNKSQKAIFDEGLGLVWQFQPTKDRRPPPPKKATEGGRVVIAELPSKLTDAQKALLGVAGF